MRVDRPASLHYTGGTQLPQLQVLKGICVLLVIEIHAPSAWHGVLLYIMRIAVPLFFMITGYFLLDSQGVLQPQKLKRSIGKLASIYLWAQLLYICIMIVWRVVNHEPHKLLIPLTDWYGMFLGGWWSAHLWYLMAAVQAMAVMFVLLRFNGARWIMWLAVAGLITGVSLPWLWQTLEGIYVARNSMTVALPCMVIGMTVRRNEHRLQRLTKAAWGVVVVLLLAAACIEISLIENHNPHLVNGINVFAMTVPLSAAVFAATLRWGYTGWLSPLEILGRRHSLNVYIIHVAAIWILLGISRTTGYSFCYYHAMELTTLISIALSAGWIAAKNHKLLKRRNLSSI